MAVVQISRIQIRRGQENTGTGLPQLASGEMAWAIDTQSLYIGNGAVSEGAPAVGNTKILTEADNILDLAGQYIYKENNSTIQTGVDPNYPVERTLRQRLDERVTSAAYGIESGSTDQAEAIQRAIDNLFVTNLNIGPTERVTLEFLPGTYTFSETIYLPSYVSIVGAGKQKTIFNFTGPTGTAFRFVNDTSTLTSRSVIGSSTYNNQPKHCLLKGFTVNTNEPDIQAFQLDAVRDSVFEDIELTGSYGDSAGDSTSPGAGYALGLYALSSVVTCQRNIFNRVSASGFIKAVFAKQDIFNNTWKDCIFQDSRWGIDFGTGANGTSSGEQFGPRKNLIENCFFYNIERNGIIINNGYGNKSRGNTFENVGNDGGGNATNLYSQVHFVVKGNTSVNDNFDRQLDLAQTFVNTYLPEIDGKVYYHNLNTETVNLVTATPGLHDILRIPYNGETGFEINYVLKSNNYTQMRRGVIKIAVDDANSSLQVVDDYEYTGTAGQDTRVIFAGRLLDNCMILTYTNSNSADTTVMTYSYSALS